MSSLFSVGGQHGVLKIDELHADTYYKFVIGANPAGEQRQLVTRGPGKEKAATRVLIRIPPSHASRRLQEIVEKDWRDASNAFEILARSYSSHEWETMIFPSLTVPLVLMPREGNLVTGFEWNAPGGTGKPGESFKAVAVRETKEEAAVIVVGTCEPFPPGMFASGIYDEIQHVSFAFIVDSPATLVEGAKRWREVPLSEFRAWATAQNNREQPSGWESGKFIPVDGKVVLALWWFIQAYSP